MRPLHLAPLSAGFALLLGLLTWQAGPAALSAAAQKKDDPFAGLDVPYKQPKRQQPRRGNVPPRRNPPQPQPQPQQPRAMCVHCGVEKVAKTGEACPKCALLRCSQCRQFVESEADLQAFNTLRGNRRVCLKCVAKYTCPVCQKPNLDAPRSGAMHLRCMAARLCPDCRNPNRLAPAPGEYCSVCEKRHKCPLSEEIVKGKAPGSLCGDHLRQIREARLWITGELQQLEQARPLELRLPLLGETFGSRLKLPPSAAPLEKLVTLHRSLTVVLKQEDGQPVDPGLIRATPSTESIRLAPTADGVRADDVQESFSLRLSFAEPNDWAFVRSEDARAALKDLPAPKPRIVPSPIKRTIPPSLPPSAAPIPEEDRRGLMRTPLTRPPSLDPTQPSLVRQAVSAAANLEAASGRIRNSGAGLPSADPEARKRLWRDLERELLAVSEAEAVLQQVGAAVGQLDQREDVGALQRVWKSSAKEVKEVKELKLPPQRLNDLVQRLLAFTETARMRAAAERAVVLWLQGECITPLEPERQRALTSLQRDLQSFPASPRLKLDALQQLQTHYLEALRREEMLRPEIQRLALAPREQEQETHYLDYVHSVRVRRLQVELRFERDDSEPAKGDVYEVGGQKLALTPEGNYLKAKVPAEGIAAGAVVRRIRESSERRFEARGVLKAEHLNGAVIDLPPLELTAIRSARLPAVPGGAQILEEIPGIKKAGAKLADERQKLIEGNIQFDPDGTWLVSTGTELGENRVVYRVRPSPFNPNIYVPERGIFGKVSDGVNDTTDLGRKLEGPVLVESIRIEGREAGHIAGLRINESRIDMLRNKLGGDPTAEGELRYLDGSVLVGFSRGMLKSIEVRRPLDDRAQPPLIQPGTAAEPASGLVTEINYANATFKVAIGPGFNPDIGQKLRITVGGQAMAVQRNKYRFMARVLSKTEEFAACEMVFVDEQGFVVTDREGRPDLDKNGQVQLDKNGKTKYEKPIDRKVLRDGVACLPNPITRATRLAIPAGAKR